MDNSHQESLFNYADCKKFEHARSLRKNHTEAENELWQRLRNRQVLRFKFRRQHPFGNFILDFYCPELKLCIEVDGEIHNSEDEIEYDLHRTTVLNASEIKVLRYTNEEILKDPFEIARQISVAIKNMN